MLLLLLLFFFVMRTSSVQKQATKPKQKHTKPTTTRKKLNDFKPTKKKKKTSCGQLLESNKQTVIPTFVGQLTNSCNETTRVNGSIAIPPGNKNAAANKNSHF